MKIVPQRNCPDCGGVIPEIKPFRGGRLSTRCLACQVVYRKRYRQEYYYSNLEAFTQYRRNWRAGNDARWLAYLRGRNRENYWRKQAALGKPRVKKSRYGRPK